MLDEVPVKKAGAKAKLVTSTGGVGSGVRHLSQDELDAYMNGRLPSARLDSCSTHLDSCDACRAELEDLRTFKNSAVGLSQSGSLGRELDRRKRQRQLRAAGSAAMVAVVVAAIAAAGWWQFGKTRAQRTSVAATAATATRGTTGAQPHGSAPVTTLVQATTSTSGSATQTRSTLPPSNQLVSAPQPRTASVVIPQSATQRVAQSPAAATPAASPRVAAQPASVPSVATAAPSRVASQLGVAGATPSAAAAPPTTTFALLGPFGDEIADARPEFTWQPLAGATKYSVVIVDEGLRPVQHSHGVKTTSWRPRRPLRRGRTYLWQVTATLRNGTKIVAIGPTSSEARIHIAQTPSDKLVDNKTR